MPLSDVIPVLENLGLRVMGEHPYGLQLDDGQKVYIHNFVLVYTLGERIDMQAVKCLFQEAFKNISEETDFINDLKINSANLVDVILDVEDEFGIEIDNESMEKMLSVKSAIDIIETKLAET
jgi:acyl carrier protein